jgi:SAM-dependent methyltransferase
MPPAWLRAEARSVYGTDPASYEAGRPEYPARVYELLERRCGIRAGTRVLEIGPGTGRVTRRLVDLGAVVTAVEPDPGLSRYLGDETARQQVEVLQSSFEDADLADAAFDAIVAAMSFHWVDPTVGLPKLGRVVRPGGWVALWWTVFGDPERPDPFADASTALLEAHDAVVSLPQPQYELDVAARTGDLRDGAGCVEVEGELIRWTIRLDPRAVGALYGSMIRVRRLPSGEREELLDALEAIATADFGGIVERPFVTAIYTGRRPP